MIEDPDLTLPAVKLVAVAEKLLLMESHFRTPEAIGAVQNSNLTCGTCSGGRLGLALCVRLPK